MSFKAKPRYPTTFNRRHRLSNFLLNYGYANRIPGCWVLSGFLIGPDRFPSRTIWNVLNERAQHRLLKNGHDPDQY